MEQESKSAAILADPQKFEEALIEFFNKYDKNKDGYLDLKEFQEVELDAEAEYGDFKFFIRCEDIYLKELDKNGDGKISRDELAVHFHDILVNRANKEKSEINQKVMYESSRRVAQLEIERLKENLEKIKGGLKTCVDHALYGGVTVEELEEKIKYWEGQLAKNITLDEVCY